MQQQSAVIIGVGAEQGIGGALCRRFAGEGLHVIAGGRTSAKLDPLVDAIRRDGHSAEAFVMDVTAEADVLALFDHAMNLPNGIAPPSVVVFNAGNNQMIDFRQLSAEQFEAFWRVGCLAGFLAGREAARRLLPLGRGTVIFTGASASLRGKPGFAHFSAAKGGLRMIAQSMAREYGPLGLHVAHVIVDGGVDGERLRMAYPAFVERAGADGLLNVDAIAEQYWQIHAQHPSAWTHEVDLRPFREAF